MEVKNKILYHFHKKGIHDELWKVGNELIIDDNYNTDLLDVLNEFDTAVNTSDGDRVTFSQIIRNYLDEDAPTDVLKKMLEECILIIRNTNLFTGEKALEEVRKKEFNNYPSRKHCLFLVDESDIKYWYSELKENKLELFKVSVNGEIFKFNAECLPDRDLTYKENINKSKKYWKSENKYSNKNEYLFQGKVKILEKINIEEII